MQSFESSVRDSSIDIAIRDLVTRGLDREEARGPDAYIPELYLIVFVLLINEYNGSCSGTTVSICNRLVLYAVAGYEEVQGDRRRAWNSSRLRALQVPRLS
jgi:hypothetical protein